MVAQADQTKIPFMEQDAYTCRLYLYASFYKGKMTKISKLSESFVVTLSQINSGSTLVVDDVVLFNMATLYKSVKLGNFKEAGLSRN